MKKPIPLLIDFDGILKIGAEPAEDAQAFLTFIAKNNIPSIIISNSTLMSGQGVKDFLSLHYIETDISCITAVDASIQYITENKLKVSVYCSDKVKPMFNESSDDANPDAVLIGDLEDKWTYDILNDIFRKVYNGAELIAMQKNKFWKPAGELNLDAGAFVAAIEYASGKQSVLIGKPSPLYFTAALAKLGYGPGSEFIMIGDDVENDVEAVQKINGKGILVYTGKTKFPLPPGFRIKPDAEARSLSEVITYLESILN